MSVDEPGWYLRGLNLVNCASLKKHVPSAWIFKQNLDVLSSYSYDLCKNVSLSFQMLSIFLPATLFKEDSLMDPLIRSSL